MTNQYTQPGALPPPQPCKGPKPLVIALIVVGIFCLGGCCVAGLLAAIAIPNYREASVRSQVSRVRSDMRSFATALEAYYVDNNAYPPHTTLPSEAFNADSALGASPTRPSFRVLTQRGPQTLTTPIAYLYAYYPDPFTPRESGLTFCYYTDGDGWITWSPGPDKDYDIVPGRDYTSALLQPSPHLLATVTYDPTNGTVSNGDIWRVKY